MDAAIDLTDLKNIDSAQRHKAANKLSIGGMAEPQTLDVEREHAELPLPMIDSLLAALWRCALSIFFKSVRSMSASASSLVSPA